MPIGLGLCSSHAPSLFYSTYEGWERMHHNLNDGHPQPPETELETPQLISQRVPAIKSHFATLRDQIASYKPDTIIAIIGDQREWFDDSNIPNIAVYTGRDAWGFHCTGAMDEKPPANVQGNPRFRVKVPVDQHMSNQLLEGLIAQGFDVANVSGSNPLETHKSGIPHGWSNVAPHIQPDPENPIPIVLVFVNVDDGPPAILNGQRCLKLGKSIAKVCEKLDKRIAIFGSGGMSHDPRGPRSGWVDEPLDNWFFDQITNGTIANMKALFSFRSENLVGGTGELRCWIAVAGAIDYIRPGHNGVKVGYIPARKVTTGAGWAYWPIIEDKTPVGLQASKF